MIACVVAIASTSARQGVPPPGGGPPRQMIVLNPGTAFILGRVVEAGTTTPVSGSTVRLSGAALGAKDTSRFSNGVDGGPREVVTGAHGDFLFRDLPAGAYALSASAPGFVNGAFGLGRPSQLVATLDAVRTIDLSEGEKLTAVLVPLWRKAGIIGTVVDEAGEPMVGIPMSILHRVVDWGGAVMQQAFAATTDDRGVYHADVTPGTYIVGVMVPPVTAPASAVDEMQVAEASGGAAIRAFSDTVRINGAPVPPSSGVRIDSWILSGQGRSGLVAPPISADARGLRLYPSTYYPGSATPAAATVLSVESGEERSGINIQLRPQAVHRVSGRVMGPNGPAGGVGIRLLAPDPAVVARMNRFRWSTRRWR